MPIRRTRRPAGWPGRSPPARRRDDQPAPLAETTGPPRVRAAARHPADRPGQQRPGRPDARIDVGGSGELRRGGDRLRSAVGPAVRARRRRPRCSATSRRCSSWSPSCTRWSTATSWPSAGCRSPSSRHDRAVAELRQHRIRRDRLIAWLASREAEVPVARARVRADGRAAGRRDRSRADPARCWSRLPAVLPGSGWPRGRRRPVRALTQLRDHHDLARSWGAPLQAWPGVRLAEQLDGPGRRPSRSTKPASTIRNTRG